MNPYNTAQVLPGYWYWCGQAIQRGLYNVIMRTLSNGNWYETHVGHGISKHCGFCVANFDLPNSLPFLCQIGPEL